MTRRIEERNEKEQRQNEKGMACDFMILITISFLFLGSTICGEKCGFAGGLSEIFLVPKKL